MSKQAYILTNNGNKHTQQIHKNSRAKSKTHIHIHNHTPQSPPVQQSCPQSAITTAFAVLPEEDPTFSTAFTTSIPSTTLPNTTCFPSSHSVLSVQMKNCDPFVPGPAFAIDKIPGPVCFLMKFSSANFDP